MNSWFRSKKNTEVLGLSLHGPLVEGIVLRRDGPRFQLGSTFRHSFSADPLTGDLTVLGRELRTALDAAGIQVRACTVALPASWAMTLSTTLPDLPDADTESLLLLEAERGFSFPPEALALVTSRFKTADGNQHATQFAIQRDRIARLEELLRVARLVPESITLGSLQIVEMLSSSGRADAITMLVSATQMELVVAAQGGIVALRTWDLPLANPTRELRVTLAQLPVAMVAELKRLQLVGNGPPVDHLAAELGSRVAALGLQLEHLTRFTPGTASAGLPSDVPLSPAIAVAAFHLTGNPQPFEFLPPKVSAWQQYSERYASRKLVAVGQVAAALACIVLLLFLWQQFQLSRLRSKWSGISSRVQVAENLQLQIKKYRPWYDTSVRSLAILRRVTEAFPEDGEVTAKIIEIRENGTVTCTGTARDQPALLRTLERLRTTSDVAGVQLDQVRGKAPMQFSFNFQWAASPR